MIRVIVVKNRSVNLRLDVGIRGSQDQRGNEPDRDGLLPERNRAARAGSERVITERSQTPGHEMREQAASASPGGEGRGEGGLLCRPDPAAGKGQTASSNDGEPENAGQSADENCDGRAALLQWPDKRVFRGARCVRDPTCSWDKAEHTPLRFERGNATSAGKDVTELFDGAFFVEAADPDGQSGDAAIAPEARAAISVAKGDGRPADCINPAQLVFFVVSE